MPPNATAPDDDANAAAAAPQADRPGGGDPDDIAHADTLLMGLAAHAPPHPGRPLAWCLAAVALVTGALVAARMFQQLDRVPTVAAPTVLAWAATSALAVAGAGATARFTRTVRGAAIALFVWGVVLGVVHVVLCEGAIAADAHEWLARTGAMLGAPARAAREAGPWGVALGAMLAPPVAATVVARQARSADATNALRLLTGAWLLVEGWFVESFLAHTALWPLPAAAVAAGALYVALALRSDARARDPGEIAREAPLAAAYRARRRRVALGVLVAGLTVAPLLALARAPRYAPRAVLLAYGDAEVTPCTTYAVPGVELWRIAPTNDSPARLVGADRAGRLVRGADLVRRAGRLPPMELARLAAATLFDDAEATVLVPGPRTPDMDPLLAARVTPPALEGDTLAFWMERQLRAPTGARYPLVTAVRVDIATGEILRVDDARGRNIGRPRHVDEPRRGP